MTKEQNKFYEDVIIEAIKQDDEVPKTNDRRKILKYADDRFRSEYGHEIQRFGEQKARENWLQGIAINIPFYNADIINLAKKSGTLRQDATEREEQKILDNYWRFMSNKIGVLNNKYKVRDETYGKPKVKRSLKPQSIVREHKRTGTRGVRRHVRRNKK